MVHSKIYEQYKKMLPEYEKITMEWFPNGKNSIRVRLKNRLDLIFIYNKTDDWCFETVKSYINHMKGG